MHPHADSRIPNIWISRNSAKLKNKKILLVDDVMTTGATTFCCAEELIKGEVNCVIILTAAKSKL